MAAKCPQPPKNFKRATQVEADAPADSLPCWEAGTVGAGLRIGIARLDTHEREVSSSA